MSEQKMTFGTKAETLERLEGFLETAEVLPQVRFTASDWATGQAACVDRMMKGFASHDREVIVRSSALSEDSADESKAGAFASVARVPIDSREALIDAVGVVVASFGADPDPGNQIFVQPFLREAAISGVLFSRHLDSMAPYYVVNFDDSTSRTDTVTGGHSNQLRTVIRFRQHPTDFPFLEGLFNATEELEKILGCDHIDVEFAIDSSGKVFILQVRPLARGGRPLIDEARIGAYLGKIRKKVIKLQRPHPYLHGRRTILGVMPDWNPAEIIGTKPRPLALSLYKQLVTDRTWAYQRDNYGYRNLRSFPLMVTLCGHPYIDVRVSFNSFIPKNLDEGLSEKLCDYYIGRLLETPSDHDKVEFNILHSCYDFNIDESLTRLGEAGFSDRECGDLKRALLDLTNGILSTSGVFSTDLAKIEELETRQKAVLESNLPTVDRIYWLMEDCGRYGTLPFAGLARAGFVAVQLLRSLRDQGAMSSEEFDAFMGSLNTVAKRMPRDHQSLDPEEFLKRYGHLRPGTYDILSRRYDEAFDLYFSEDQRSQGNSKIGFTLDGALRSRIQDLLNEHDLGVNANELLNFIRAAIEGREHAKYVFTRSLSEVLRLIGDLAQRYGISANEASFLNIGTILELYATLDHRDLETILLEEIARNRALYRVTETIRLPALIVEPNDVYEFELATGAPNFVTLGRCCAQVATVESPDMDFEGKIAFIPSADPGFDWLFARKIAGLVTMYGGANSHMAIRAAELRLPAVIGAGEKSYMEWSAAQILEIDCANRHVRVIR